MEYLHLSESPNSSQGSISLLLTFDLTVNAKQWQTNRENNVQTTKDKEDIEDKENNPDILANVLSNTQNDWIMTAAIWRKQGLSRNAFLSCSSNECIRLTLTNSEMAGRFSLEDMNLTRIAQEEEKEALKISGAGKIHHWHRLHG